MAKIPKINKIQSISKTKTPKKNNHFVLQSKLYQKAKINPKLSEHKEVKVALTIDEMIREVKALQDIYKNGITLDNLFSYADVERVERAKKQLKIFFLRTFSKHIFKFIAKSSGLNPSEYYQIEVQFVDIEEMINQGKSAEYILHNSRIKTQCSCPDFKYRFRYYLTKMDAVLGLKEHRFPKITNPHKEHKFLCKHQILVMNGITKNSFLNIFTRYINNLQKGKKGIKVTKKDIASTYISSGKSEIKR